MRLISKPNKQYLLTFQVSRYCQLALWGTAGKRGDSEADIKTKKAVSSHFSSKQILPIGFVGYCWQTRRQ